MNTKCPQLDTLRMVSQIKINGPDKMATVGKKKSVDFFILRKIVNQINVI